MNLTTAVAIVLSAVAFTATVSAKASKATKTAKAVKAIGGMYGSYSMSYSMSMSLPSCKEKRGLVYDTGTAYLSVNINPLITPNPGETFNYFTYSGAESNPGSVECGADADDGPGIMRFKADNADAPDGTIAECTYSACYDWTCEPDCCCENSIFIEVTD
ncbi:hypothetical protein ACHAXM_004822 [Skeletonema potamos]|jgi:hypothetical protein